MSPEPAGPSFDDLAARQEALVRALVAGAPLPAGFDAARVGAAARALRDKRFGEVGRVWPSLLPYRREFLAWAEGRPSAGPSRDGREFARAHRRLLDPEAATALAVCEALWRDEDEPRRRRGPAVRRVPGGLVMAFAGRVVTLRRRRLGSGGEPRGLTARAGRRGLHANRSAHRRRRLPRAERRDPGGGAQGVKGFGDEFVGIPRRLARRPRTRRRAAGPGGSAGHPAARRHDPRLLAHQPVQDRRRDRRASGERSTALRASTP